MARLGNILLERGLVTESQLAVALTLQAKQGNRLGDILVSEGMLGYYELYAAIAQHHRLPFIDLLTEKTDSNLLRHVDRDSYLNLRIVPWREKNGVTWYAACEPGDEVDAWIWQRSGRHYKLTITSPLDIRRIIEKHFGPAMEKDSCLSLWQRTPHASARVTLLERQKEFFSGLAFLALAAITLMPIASALLLVTFCQLIFALNTVFKTACFIRGGQRQSVTKEEWQNRLATLDESSLPVYTILLPMYRETHSLPRMLAAMKRLDYPAAKLDIKLVLEEDDVESLGALHALNPRHQFEIIRVPKGEPRTKPKACNYALNFARGEFVTIFDADDQPDPDQLKKAVYLFRTSPKDVVCLQARLNYYNSNDTLLTRLFSLEYTMLFHFILHGLERFGIPIPLGGTSNHIALKRLVALGEWDPFNVTEDADLGTRLAARGYRTAMLDSATMEEAPTQVLPWLRQRSRWIKGYMQTWLVHMRRPVQLYSTLGWRGFLGFQFFVGVSSFIFLTSPVVWIMSLAWMAQAVWVNAVPFPFWLACLSGLNLLTNLLTSWFCAACCAQHYTEQKRPLWPAVLLYPYYPILHSLASYKALRQLIVKPHFWEKTVHGLTKQADKGITEHELVVISGNALTVGGIIG